MRCSRFGFFRSPELTFSWERLSRFRSEWMRCSRKSRISRGRASSSHPLTSVRGHGRLCRKVLDARWSEGRICRQSSWPPPKGVELGLSTYQCSSQRQYNTEQSWRNGMEGCLGSGEQQYSCYLNMSRLAKGTEAITLTAIAVMDAEKVLDLNYLSLRRAPQKISAFQCFCGHEKAANRAAWQEVLISTIDDIT